VMNLQWFEASLAGEVPPEGLMPILQALWYEGKGDWDTGNADYWYSHAGRTRPSVSLKTEWQELVAELLGRQAE
jgi:hypothetical protein